MTVYTVHEPPLHGEETSPDADRFQFVRDGFYGWAFLLGPLWMIWRRLWLVLFLYVVAIAVLEAALWAVAASTATRFAVALLVALLVGMEAGSLWRWTLTRRRWTNVGVVVAPDLETAEQRFFDAWSRPKPHATSGGLPPAASLRMPGAAAPDVIGLFPESPR